MDEKTYNNYITAGRILKETRDETKKLVSPGASLLEIAEKTESIIRKKGGLVAFPTNISINDIAAHYTPNENEKTVFGEKDVVKIDMGVHVDGYIADSAYTVCFDPDKKEMVSVIEKALEKALSLATPGRPVSEISEVIESEITSFGFKPVSNLTGHRLERYQLHTGFIIPNVRTGIKEILKENDVIAIEPFLTDGGGSIKEGRDVRIYMFEKQHPVRMTAARQVLSQSKEQFSGLPFALRWIKNPRGILLNRAIRELVSVGAIYEYNVLKEILGGTVTQAEHTVIVKDKPVITTR